MNITRKDVESLSHSLNYGTIPIYQVEQRALEMLRQNCYKLGANSGIYGLNFELYLHAGKHPALLVCGNRCPFGYKFLYLGDVKEVVIYDKDLLF